MKLGKISVTIEISMSEFGMLESGSYLLGCQRSEIKGHTIVCTPEEFLSYAINTALADLESCQECRATSNFN